MSNIAKVHYRELADGSVVIVELEGFLSQQGIKEKYDSEVYRNYAYPRMFKNDRNVYIDQTALGGCTTYYPNSILPRTNFTNMITNMKQCGKNLVDAIRKVKEAKKNPVEVIEI